MKVLIVDDVPANRFLLRRLLEREGHSVIETEDGPSGLSSLNSESIDIALLDVMMPGMSGFDVCREIRRSYSADQLPVLFITAKTQDQDLVEGFEAGGNDYLIKPINPVVFLSRLRAQVQLLTARRVLEESYHRLAERRRLEAVGLFAGGIAHNFNNILGTILGSAELIGLLSEESPDVKNAADLITQAVTRGSTLVSSLLTVACPPTGGTVECPHAIVSSTLELLPALSGHRIELCLDMPVDFPALAISPEQLSQVLMELLKNAIEAIPDQGKITVRAALAPVTTEPRQAHIIVADTGIGIPETLRHNLFDPFRSTKNVHSQTNLSLDGSGLGLSAVYSILKGCSGAIRILETSDIGTQVQITIPLYCPATEHPTNPSP